MKTSDFEYHLPSDFIAQYPVEPRDSSRLFVLDRRESTYSHHQFSEIIHFLEPADLLVLNETKVLPVRLRVKKLPGGGRREILLLERKGPNLWVTLVGGSGLQLGTSIALNSEIEGEILEDLGRAQRLIRFSHPISPRLETLGEMPLPPYIHAPLKSSDDYQTVYAQVPGSAAAPTAGFHFTDELLKRISESGVTIVKITLHIGVDTFLPVTEMNPSQHKIHTEWCKLSPEVVREVNRTRKNGGRVIAVGTTTVRALETAAQDNLSRTLTAYEGSTDLFILPGYTFRIVDSMITNFHLPRSTLLMMVSAFAGRARIMKAYRAALEERYRFYSFGDAMLIL